MSSILTTHFDGQSNRIGPICASIHPQVCALTAELFEVQNLIVEIYRETGNIRMQEIFVYVVNIARFTKFFCTWILPLIYTVDVLTFRHDFSEYLLNFPVANLPMVQIRIFSCSTVRWQTIDLDTQTDGCHQMHYLPAMRSIIIWDRSPVQSTRPMHENLWLFKLYLWRVWE